MRSCSISAAPDDQASEDYFRRLAIVPNHGIAPSGKNTHRRHRDGSIDLAQGRKPKTDRIHPMDMAVDPRFLRLGLDLNGSLEDLMPSLMTGLPRLMIAAVLGLRTPRNT